MENIDIPLYVDLDGTFIKSDMLFESLLVAFRKDPLNIFRSIYWYLKGKACLKYKLSQQADIDVKNIPNNIELFDFLHQQKEKGRSIVLATASTEKYAKEFVGAFDIFDSYICSDNKLNLKGQKKLDKIKGLTNDFAYAGNSNEDFDIFKESKESYLVNPTLKARRLASKNGVSRTFDNKPLSFPDKIKVWAKQIRVQQWLKNLLIFVPLLVSGNFSSTRFVELTFLGFICFSFLASSTYILNDLLDANSDRQHPRKKNRPVASGAISIPMAVFAGVVLFFVSIVVSVWLIKGAFVYLLFGYLVLTLFYSFKLKQILGLDVIILASLYTIRILIGAAILHVNVSFWLLSFSMFVFFSLALVKRCSELKTMQLQKKENAAGRGYKSQDYTILMSLGTSASLMSVVMFCFYAQSNILIQQYQKPTLLWLIIPGLAYWLTRMWIKTDRGEMHDDPIIFSIKDKGSLVTIGAIIIITLVAQIL